MENHNLKDLSLAEIKALRQSLDFIQITGKDAMFIGLLQNKLTTQIQEIENPQSTPPSKSNKKK